MSPGMVCTNSGSIQGSFIPDVQTINTSLEVLNSAIC